MQPPKMTFWSQIGPLIKSYECFMFLLNFRLEITWTDGFLKDLNRFFLSILPPLLKHTHPTPHVFDCSQIFKILTPTRNFTISTLKIYLNIIYQRTNFALKIWSKTHNWTNFTLKMHFFCQKSKFSNERK